MHQHFLVEAKKAQFSRVDDTQLSRLRKAYANNSSITIKLTTAQLSKMVQLGAFLPLLGLTLATALKAKAKVQKHKATILAKYSKTFCE